MEKELDFEEERQDKLDMILELAQEHDLALNLRKEHETDASRRIFVRTVFALLEGVSCVIRQFATESILEKASQGGEIPIQVLHFLEDLSYDLSNNGEIKKLNRNKYGFKSLLAFGLRIFSDEIDHDSSKIFGDAGWEKVQKTISIRNRITHPKRTDDLAVSAEDAAIVDAAYCFIHNTFVEMYFQLRQRRIAQGTLPEE